MHFDISDADSVFVLGIDKISVDNNSLLSLLNLISELNKTKVSFFVKKGNSERRQGLALNWVVEVVVKYFGSQLLLLVKVVHFKLSNPCFLIQPRHFDGFSHLLVYPFLILLLHQSYPVCGIVFAFVQFNMSNYKFKLLLEDGDIFDQIQWFLQLE